jgi:hypothetical protein
VPYSPHTPSPSNPPHSPRSHSPGGGDVTLWGAGLDERARSQSPRGDGAEGGDTGGALVGVGLTFHRPDGRGGVLVKRVKERGAAAADGRVVAGDRLLGLSY